MHEKRPLCGLAVDPDADDGDIGKCQYQRQQGEENSSIAEHSRQEGLGETAHNEQ